MSARGHRNWWIGLLAGIVAILVGVIFVLSQRRTVVLAYLPGLPELAGRPDAFRDRVETADRRASGWVYSVAGLEELSQLYQANGDYEEAMQCLEGLEALEPENPVWLHRHATILAQFGRLDEAIALWEQAVATGTDYLPVHVRLGEALLKANKIDGARAAFQRGLKHDADNLYALLGLARCATTEQGWTEARDLLEKAVKIDPNFVGALTLLVTAYENLGDPDRANALRVEVGMREFVDIDDPWIDVLMDDCYDAYRVSVAAAVAKLGGNVDRAQHLVERATTLAPGQAAYWRQLGKLHLQRNNYPEGRRHLERAVKLDPGDTEAWGLLIELFDSQKDYRALDRAIEEGLKASPKSMALHLAKGRRLAGQDRQGEAIRELKLAKSLKPDEVRPYLELAMIYFQLERIAEGISEMKAALEIEPDNPLALGVVTRAAIHAGNQTEADAWLERIEKQPRFPANDLRTIRQEYRAAFGTRQ